MSAEQSGHATLYDVVIWLTRHWWRLVLLAAICGAVTFFTVKRQPFQYTAVATVVPAGAMNSGSSQPSGISGLASLAGLSVGGQDERTKLALALLQSRFLIDSFIAEQRIEPLLKADGRKGPTTPAERELIFKRFAKMVEAKQAQDSSLVVVRVTWKDPALAAEWANGLIAKVNSEMRQRALIDAGERRIFLEGELGRTGNVELRTSITELIANQLRTSMMARQPSGFAFEVVDPALPPTKPSGPRIVVLTAAGAVLGLLIGIIWGLVATVKRP